MDIKDKMNNVIVAIAKDGKVIITCDPATAKIDPDTDKLFKTGTGKSYVISKTFWATLDNGMQLHMQLIQPDAELKAQAKAKTAEDKADYEEFCRQKRLKESAELVEEKEAEANA